MKILSESVGKDELKSAGLEIERFHLINCSTNVVYGIYTLLRKRDVVVYRKLNMIYSLDASSKIHAPVQSVTDIASGEIFSTH